MEDTLLNRLPTTLRVDKTKTKHLKVIAPGCMSEITAHFIDLCVLHRYGELQLPFGEMVLKGASFE